jgi:hypothetical protein
MDGNDLFDLTKKLNSCGTIRPKRKVMPQDLRLNLEGAT